MSRSSPLGWVVAWSAMAAAVAVPAQPAPQPAATSRAPAAQPLAHRSAFDDYRPFTDEKVQPWKQSNDTVRSVGGWRAYAKEAQDALPAPADAPASATGEPSGGHDKH